MTGSESFFRFTTTRPVAILMVVIGVIVFGWISYQQLSVNLMPDISYPSLTVRTMYPGTAPEEVETAISRPIEQALGVVDNLVSISSVSKAGQSDVKLEFTWDTDMNKATADVREMLDQVFLPEDAERPLILRYDPSLDPIMRLGLYGDASLFYLRYLAEEEIKRTLETVEGVAAVKVKGGLEEEIQVELSEQKLALIGIDIQQVKNRLAQENINLAGGNLKEGQTEYLVRTLNEFKTVDEIANVVIGTWNGREIKVRDVGEVRRTHKDREIITRLNGQESVEIEIYKEADANVVAVAERVKRRVFGTPEQQAFVKTLRQGEQTTDGKATDGRKGELQKRRMTNFIAYQLPEGVRIEVLSDQSVFIQHAVDEVKSTAKLGGLLAVLILFLFLRSVRSTLIVGISIPISIVATFAAMRLFDVSLNIMSLGGLALGIGMLVDNSIVVLESIARCREEGDALIPATIRGVSEVGGAVFASTLTTVAVFFPIVFVEGVAGQIFADLALTVVFSLLASLAVALFLIPMLSSREAGRFIKGVKIPDHHILSFHADTEGETFSGIMDWLSRIGYTTLSAGVKLFQILAGFLLALVKALLVPPIIPILLLEAILQKAKLWNRSIGQALIGFAERDSLFGLQFVRNIWPGYLSYPSLGTCLGDINTVWLRWKQRPPLARTATLMILPLQIMFYLIKYFFLWVFEILFRFWHFAVLSAAILLKFIYLQIKYILLPVFHLVFSGFNHGWRKLAHQYPRILHFSLQHRALTLGSVVALFVLSMGIILPRVGSELIPEVHQGEFNIDVSLPVGTPVEETDAKILGIQQYLSAQPAVAKVASVAGTDRTASTESEEGEHTARLTVTIHRNGDVIRREESLIRDIREKMNAFTGITWKISRPVLFSFKTPVEIHIQGYHLQTLHRIAREVEKKIRDIPGVYDVKSNIQRGNPEVQIIYNRALLARHGLNILDVAAIVRNKIRGDVATEFKDMDRKIDILVRLRERDRQSIEDLRRLIVNPGDPVPLPLEAVADIRISEGPAEIRRVEQQRTAVISANISGRDLQSVSEDIYAVLRRIDMPDEFSYRLAGQNEEMQTSLNSLKLALALAIFLVYIVMASQFESLIHPFVIIFTIPMALIGVVFTLWILDIPFSVVVFLGLIMLAGIVVNNAIVLVDYINKLRSRGLEKIEAIVQAGRIRLRPILMTTATTALGLLPMALGLGEGAEIRTPMAITVIVGLITSTVLTLIVIPTVYSVMAPEFKKSAEE